MILWRLQTVRDIKNPKNWSFETKQVHAGQEQPDPAQAHGPCRFTLQHPMSLKIAAMERTSLH